MLKRLEALLSGHPALVFAASLAVAVGLPVFAAVTVLDTETGQWTPPIDASMDPISASRGEPGPEKVLYVALRFDTLFDPDALRQLRDFIEALEDLEGVRSVESLAGAVRVDRSEGFADVLGALDTLPEDVTAARAFGAEILASPLYSTVVSRDERSTLMFVTPAPGAQLDLEAIRAIAQATAPDATLLLTGPYAVEQQAVPLLLEDMAHTLPAALVLLTLVATFTLRSFRGVVLAIGANVGATTSTLALFVLAGWQLNIVTVITPAVIFVVGFAYAVHVLTEFDHQLHQEERELREVIVATMRHVTPPLALTVFTTCAGFLSLLVSRIEAIRDFGTLCAVGVVVALTASLLPLPAALALWPPRASHHASGREFSRFNDRWAARFSVLATRKRALLLQLGALVTAVATVGVLQIRTNTDFISNFRPDSSVRRDFETLSRDFAGSVPIEIRVRAPYEEAFLEPENLHALSRLQKALLDMPEVGQTTSISDYVSFLYGLGGGVEPGALPEREAMIYQLLVASPAEGRLRFVDNRYQEAELRVQAHSLASADLLDWVRRVERELAATLPEYLELRVVGDAVQIAATVEELTRGQLASIAVALAVIFLVLALLFQSPRAGLFAMIPNMIPIAVYFGTLGLLGIPLNVTTALVACAVLGIAVDDSIHFLTRFNEAARVRADESSGVADALRQTLRPITVTTAALVAGFLALASSELRGQVEFGVLAAFTLAFAWLLDITFTPALCGKLRFVTLWDSLTLDLGEQPQKTIPLFADMSPRQARIAVSLGTLRNVRAGDRLLSYGDPGGSIFVVLEGEVEVRLPTVHEPVANYGRGALLGEAAAFGGKRNANVDARSDVRIVRWTSRSLDRIQRRYPRVAVPLLRNLSREMALHLSKANDSIAALSERLASSAKSS